MEMLLKSSCLRERGNTSSDTWPTWYLKLFVTFAGIFANIGLSYLQSLKMCLLATKGIFSTSLIFLKDSLPLWE